MLYLMYYLHCHICPFFSSTQFKLLRLLQKRKKWFEINLKSSNPFKLWILLISVFETTLLNNFFLKKIFCCTQIFFSNVLTHLEKWFSQVFSLTIVSILKVSFSSQDIDFFFKIFNFSIKNLHSYCFRDSRH